MKKRMLTAALCLLFAMAMAACGGGGDEASQTTESSGEAESEVLDEGIDISGTEFSSGDLSVTIPDGWEMAVGEDDWAANEDIKILESANKTEAGDHGEVYVRIEVSDYSKMDSLFNEEALKADAEEYDDEDALPTARLFNDNILMSCRQYGYVGDSAEDWLYAGFTSDGRLLEIRAYNDADFANDENRQAIKVILASLSIGGEPLSAE